MDVEEIQEIADPFRAEGVRVAARSDRPFLLVGDDAWRVDSGRVDIFVVQLEAGQPVGARHHLVRVESDHVVFAVDTRAPSATLGLLAVGDAGTVLHHVPLARVREWARDPLRVDAVVRAVDGWVEALCSGVDAGAVPQRCVDLDSGTDTRLAVNAIARPKRGVAWINHLEGSSQFLDVSTLSFNGDGFFPLARRAWLQVREPSNLRLHDTTALVGGDEIWHGLTRLSHAVLGYTKGKLAAAIPAERERLRRKAVARRGALVGALGSLAQTMRSRSSDAPAPTSAPGSTERDDAWLAACRLVGDALKLRVARPGEASPNAKQEPVAAIAKASGFRTRTVILRDRWWKEDNGPLLAVVEATKRPVALIFGRRGYVLHDPMADTKTPLTDEGAATIAPQAVTFYRPFSSNVMTAREILRFGLHGCGRELLIVLVIGAAAGLLATVPPLATGLLLDSVIPGANRGQLLQLVLLLVVMAVASSMFSLTRSLLMLRVQGKAMSAIQAGIWDRLLRLPMTFFRPYTAGDLAVRAMGIEEIRLILSGSLMGTLFAGVFSIFNIGLLFHFSVGLAWRGLLLILVAGVATGMIGYGQLKGQRKVTRLQSRTSGVVLQLLSSIPKLRIAAAETHAFARWAHLFSQQRRTQFGLRTWRNCMSVLFAALPISANLLLFATAAAMLGDSHELTPGQFMAFLGAFSGVLAAVLGAAMSVVAALGVIPLYENARPILEATPEVDLNKVDPGMLSGEIDVQGLRFRYSADGPPILRDVSFKIRAGEFAAFVGPSGSGKSTLLRLLLGFETPESGAIYCDGHDLGGLDIEAVRRQIGVVLQNGRVMPGDMFSNIVGSSLSTMDDAWEAARLAGLEEDIKAMPMGMHTVVSEGGSTLSGGQRQRMMIARAIVKRPRLLCFDEATSALDNRTQAIVSASLEGLHATRIIIAHRLSTVQKADQIFVMQAGRIVEHGTFKELLAQNGAFAELARRQLA